MGKLKTLGKLLKNNPKGLIKVLGHRKIFNILSDRLYLQLIYRAETGEKLNINNPITFNEKLQWLKLNDRKMENSMYVDKYEVREYIRNTIGKEYLIPLIEVYDDVDDIEWEKLPNKFVLKCTHGSSSNIICTDKEKLDIKQTKKQLKVWMKKNWYWFGREWVYKEIKPRIICEQFMEDVHNPELNDYKIMCFNGKAENIFLCLNRSSDKGLNINIYDTDWNLLPFERTGAPNTKDRLKRPENLSLMVELAETLSKGHPFLRVDFYEINGQIYFGEMTFYPASGFKTFNPHSYDKVLGDLIVLPKEKS